MTLYGHLILFPTAVRSLAAKFVMNFSAQPLQGNPGIVLGALPIFPGTEQFDLMCNLMIN